MTHAPRPTGRRRTPALIAAAALVAAAGLPAHAAAQAPDTSAAPIAGAFPMPGTPTASPATQISLRDVTPTSVGTVSVSGSTSGHHPGKIEAWSDGRGVSFVPDSPFTAGETVTVATGLNIDGSGTGTYSFTVVAPPAAGLSTDPSKIPPALLTALTGQVPASSAKDPVYRSEPDLRMPTISVAKKASSAVAPGYVFLAPKAVFGEDPDRQQSISSGPMIVDDSGAPVWLNPDSKPGDASGGNDSDFKVQYYKGHPVLTYWRGKAVLGVGTGGEIKILNSHYKTIGSVKAGNGYGFDLHEARITPQGTMLGIIYNPVSMDLSSRGGSPNARAIDTVVQEIDIATGLVEFEFHSVGSIGLDEAIAPPAPGDDALYDYVHGNSVTEMNDGDVLLSGRSTSSAFDIDHRTGQIRQRFGGKRSDYTFVPDTARFAFQHDVEQEPDGTLKMFDNEGAPQVQPASRALTLTVDPVNHTLTQKQSFPHASPVLQTGSQGSDQLLPNGDLFVGWGSQGYFTEFSPTGETLFDGYIARGQDTYRAYRFPWRGTPDTRPSVAVSGRSLYVSWNGATRVAKWVVRTGATGRSLRTVASKARSGFETKLTVRRPGKVFRVYAIDANGKAIRHTDLERFKK